MKISVFLSYESWTCMHRWAVFIEMKGMQSPTIINISWHLTPSVVGMGIYRNFNIPVLLLSSERVIDYSQIMYKYIYFFLK